MRSLRRGVALLLLLTASWPVAAGAMDPNDPSPPVLSNFVAHPSSLPAEGGSVTISVDVFDADGIASASAVVYPPSGAALGVDLMVTDTTKPDTYSGTVDIPPNFSNESVGHAVEVHAEDLRGDQTLELSGYIDQEGQPQFDESPDAFDPAVAPTALGSGGGTVTIAASATDDRAISEVYAVVSDHAGTQTVVAMSGVSSSRFEGQWDAPPNPERDDAVYTIEIVAFDDIGQSDTVTTDPVTVAGTRPPPPPFDEAPDISDVQIDPSSLPSTGGIINLAATATDDHGINAVVVTITGPTGSEVVNLGSNGGSRYTGTWAALGNASPDPITYAIEIVALDDIGQSDTVTADPVTVAAPPEPPGTGQLAASKSALAFGRVKVGRTARRSVVLLNVGDAPVVCTAYKPASPFRLRSKREVLHLGPGQWRKLVVLYRPRAKGQHKGNLRISCEAGDLAIQLAGFSRPRS